MSANSYLTCDMDFFNSLSGLLCSRGPWECSLGDFCPENPRRDLGMIGSDILRRDNPLASPQNIGHQGSCVV